MNHKISIRRLIGLSFIICHLSFSVAITSCSDYLDKEPDIELTTDMVFQNRDKVYAWLANIYNTIVHAPDKWSLTRDGYEVMADDVVPSERWQQWDWAESIGKITGKWTINSTWAGDLWARMPQGIRHGYIFNNMVKAMPDHDLPQSEVDNMKAEVRFLTAYAWWLMAENYGGIPFTPGYIAPSDAPISELLVGQAKFDDVVDYCDKEMLEAANALPAVYQDPSKYGRINKIMALTQRSRMLLFAASPLVNGNPWYTDYVNDKGEQIFNPVYDHNKWIKAAEACKLVIDEAEAAGYELYKEMGPNGKIDPFMSTYNVHIKRWSEGNHEITFPITKESNYQGTFLRVVSVRDFGGGNGLGVYQGLVDAFFMENGLPITDPKSGYVEEGFSTAVESRPDQTVWKYGTGKEGDITARGTYNMYTHREPRFYNAVSFHNAWLAVDNRAYNFLYNGKDNIQSSSPHDAPQNGYLARKALCVTDNYKTGEVTGRQGFTYRLAFTYLDYAEAVNEAYNDESHRLDAIKYVNLIRERAGVRQYTFNAVADDDPDYIQIANTQDDVRRVVRMERRVELCCENNRWYDIRRWKIAEDIPEMCGDCYGMNALDRTGRTKEGFHVRTKFFTRVWKRQYYWFPIYVDEFEKNPNLKEAPFWLEGEE
ncbi:MAG: RagB/SusD family nutrient uptake outer membrane protein [Prevotella sp.]|nr:RagB/SusD family nutrient uptake outer membrane protein [Prevotella sp.]